MANTQLWIIKKRNIEMQLLGIRNDLIKNMYNGGYTIEEIASVVRLDKAGVSRVIRFGSNTNIIKKDVGENIKK